MQIQGHKLLKSLTWRVEITHHAGDCEILSYPETKTHKITLPEEGHPNQPRPIEYVHELCHAKLAETVHPLFSGIYFKEGTNPEFVEFYTPLFRTANDWFTDGLLMTLCPDEELQEINEHTELILTHFNKMQSGNLFELFSAAFIFAQFVHYTKQPLNTGGMLLNTIDAFLSFDPSKPSIQSLEILLNSLFASIKAKYRVYLVTEADGNDAWKFIETSV
ncbi:MAG: hypothetical protein JW780_06020 [Clostridiales bacterium]|nr:hypothetical protein [Clostridiales bacterium]